MKKFLAMLLTLCMVLAFAGCAQKAPEATEAPDQEATTEAPAVETPAATEEDVKSEGVMTYAEYVAAELESQVTVETYVQAKQSWWEDKATVYSQDKDALTSSTTWHALRKTMTSWYPAPRSKSPATNLSGQAKLR